MVRFTTPFFVLDNAKSIPITIGSQTAWEAIRNDFIIIEKTSGVGLGVEGDQCSLLCTLMKTSF